MNQEEWLLTFVWLLDVASLKNASKWGDSAVIALTTSRPSLALDIADQKYLFCGQLLFDDLYITDFQILHFAHAHSRARCEDHVVIE